MFNTRPPTQQQVSILHKGISFYWVKTHSFASGHQLFFIVLRSAGGHAFDSSGVWICFLLKKKMQVNHLGVQASTGNGPILSRKGQGRLLSALKQRHRETTGRRHLWHKTILMTFRWSFPAFRMEIKYLTRCLGSIKDRWLHRIRQGSSLCTYCTANMYSAGRLYLNILSCKHS